MVMVPAVVVLSLTWFTVEPSQASEAVGGVNIGVSLHAIVLLGPGEPIIGGVLSTTVMVWLRVCEWLPLQSVASHVRVSE